MSRPGLQRRVRVCRRCGERYVHTNRMERRSASNGGGWDAVEARWFNSHTAACARKRGEPLPLPVVRS